ncbi:MAG: hypothetical protein M2R45_03944 [Verrucomicrobia subdivision 3 bacterium]|nr:hypothetical protein [Limisphaerales bacterium]MCS1417689.1 hypothetical protein [Limisphaerales bacterium]
MIVRQRVLQCDDLRRLHAKRALNGERREELGFGIIQFIAQIENGGPVAAKAMAVGTVHM